LALAILAKEALFVYMLVLHPEGGMIKELSA
jgi:hypothetical protein